MIDAAAMDAERASPWIIARWAEGCSSRTASTSRKIGLRAQLKNGIEHSQPGGLGGC